MGGYYGHLHRDPEAVTYYVVSWDVLQADKSGRLLGQGLHIEIAESFSASFATRCQIQHALTQIALLMVVKSAFNIQNSPQGKQTGWN